MNGAELKSLREGLGLSIEQAAAQCEVFVKTWSRWEGVNIVPPGAVKLFRIMNRLDELPPRYVTVRVVTTEAGNSLSDRQPVPASSRSC